jgi:hypothetical protein
MAKAKAKAKALDRTRAVDALFERAAGLSPEQLAVVQRTQWLALDIKETLAQYKTLRLAETPLATALTAAPHGHALICYARRGREPYLEVVWDARPDASRIPLTIPASATGEELELGGISRPVPDYPLKQGDRVFEPMAEGYARQRAREALERLRVERPDFFNGRLQEMYESLDEAIEGGVTSAMQSGGPMLINATAAHVEQQSIRPAIPNPAERIVVAAEVPEADAEIMRLAAEMLAEQYVKVLGSYVECLARGDEAAKERAWRSFKVKRWFSAIGDVDVTKWYEAQSERAWGLLACTLGAEADGVEYRTRVLMYWVGLEFEILGRTVVMGPQMLSEMERDTGTGVQKLCDWRYMWHGRTMAEAKQVMENMRRNEPVMRENLARAGAVLNKARSASEAAALMRELSRELWGSRGQA